MFKFVRTHSAVSRAQMAQSCVLATLQSTLWLCEILDSTFFKFLDSTLFRLGSTFWLDSVLKLNYGGRASDDSLIWHFQNFRLPPQYRLPSSPFYDLSVNASCPAVAFSVLTLLIGQQASHPVASKNLHVSPLILHCFDAVGWVRRRPLTHNKYQGATG